MPKIRSITYFNNLYPDVTTEPIERGGQFLEQAQEAFTEAGIEVQTKRMASQPFPRGLGHNNIRTLPQVVKSVFEICQRNDIDYLSIGTVGLDDDVAYIHAIADVFAEVPDVFASAVIADKNKGVDTQRLLDVAQLKQKLSTITDDGMTNLYFTAIANCDAGSPFFPVAYHDGGPPKFALAIQAADLAVEAFHSAENPIEARDILTQKVQETADQLSIISEKLATISGIQFAGIDFSLAPFPVTEESLGYGLEGLGPVFGGSGLVASASLVMNAIENADFMKAGFSGLMLPILEDTVLAARAGEGRLSINDLLLLSAICGTGLDCIPLAGDVSDSVLRDILLDVAALSLRLDKPLTARLLPFPNKSAGDALTFDFKYFSDGQVMESPLSAESKFDVPVRFNIESRKG